MERRNKAVLAHNSQLLFKYSGGSEFTLNFIKCVGFYIGFQNPIQVLTSYPLTKGTKNHPFYFSMAVFFQLQRALESPGRLVQTLVAELMSGFQSVSLAWSQRFAFLTSSQVVLVLLDQDLHSRTTVVRCTDIS